MKTLISQALFGKNNIVSGAIALFVISLIALGCTCGKDFDLANLGKKDNTTTSTSNSSSTSDSTSSSDDLPPRELIDALVAETTADFNYAITTNDFSSMYEKSSPNFQATYTEDEFKNTFKEFVEKKRVIGPILSKAVAMDPEYSPDPYIRTEKFTDILVVKGKYATKPVPMTFEYEYIEHSGQWKLLKLIVRLV